MYVLVFSLLVCGTVGGQAEVNEAAEPIVNIALADVDEAYVRVLPDNITAIDSEVLERSIGEKLTENGLKVAAADVSDANDKQTERMMEVLQRTGVTARNVRVYSAKVPELIVRVSVLRGEGSGFCLYHIQTSFAREVYLRRARASMKAEIWRIDVPIGIADANECETAIRAAALAQVDAFVSEWKRAKSAKVSVAAEEPAADTAASAAESKSKQSGQEREIQYQYVASKNSRVFHKKGCRAARINSENSVGFSSREEAINSGRRPCQMCNP